MNFTAYYMLDSEYDEVRSDIVASAELQEPQVDRRAWLISIDDHARVVYVEHETGLELLVDIVAVGSGLLTAAQVAVPWISRFLRQVRPKIVANDAEMAASDTSAASRVRRTLNVEVHQGERGGVLTRVSVDGEFDEAELEAAILDAAAAAAAALDQVERA